MKKKIMAALLLSNLMMAIPARADEAELLARIEALEQRVAQLEQMIGIGSDAPADPNQITDTESVELGTGIWIVGKDIPVGTYNITCPSGDGNLYFYESYDSMKEDKYSYIATYWMGSEQQMKLFSKNAEEEEHYRSLFDMEIHNYVLEDGNCINTEAPSLIFTPVQ